MLLIFLLVRGSLIDDSYITLAYAKNLALHLHWGVVPQEFSNTATSPLNVVLLGALTAVTRIGGGVRPVLALGVLSVALVVIMAWGWIRIIRVWRLPLVVAALGGSSETASETLGHPPSESWSGWTMGSGVGGSAT